MCLIVACTTTPSDDALATKIKASLFSDPTTKAANLNIAVKDGVVTLSGDVPSSDVELKAMKVANSTPGVKRVNDQMKVNTALAANESPSNQAATQPPPNQTPAPTPPAQAPTAAPAPNPKPAPALQPGPPITGTPVQSTTPAKPRPQPVRFTIPAGEAVTVRMIDSIDSSRNVEGQVFRASLASPLTSRGHVVVTTGANVSVVLADVREAGRIKGRSELEVRLSRLEYQGRSYRLVSTSYSEQGNARGEQTAKRTGIGAVAGAVIGAIAGGGKGAAIGSAAGAGAGVGSQVFTHGQRVRIPSETIITFRLQAPLSIEK